MCEVEVKENVKDVALGDTVKITYTETAMFSAP
jgi:hypothetical protein